MSYGHHWGRPRTIPDEVFTAIADDVRTIIARVAPTLGFFGGIKVRGAMGGGQPILDAEHICFNGAPPRDTFWISKDFHTKNPDRSPSDDGLYWDFVMTGELPYDTVVVAALTSFKVHLPEGRLSSDGGPDEWAAGIALFCQATGRDVSFESLTQ